MVSLTVCEFEMGTPKEAALKPLEEAAEAFGAWQRTQRCGDLDEDDGLSTAELVSLEALCMVGLADELADCIQACVNLAARYNIDLQYAMDRCRERNEDRGRYDRVAPCDRI